MKEKIQEIIKNIESRNWRRTTKEIEKIYDNVITITKFLPSNSKLNERFYCILNDITSQQLCNTCHNKPVKYTNGLNGYRQCCGYKCSSNNKDIKEKTKQTNLSKYGKHPQQVKEIRNKSKQTCLEKYGTEFATQSKEFKQKRKETCLEKYGVEEFAQSKEFKNQIPSIVKKYKETCLKKYGVDNPQKNKQLKEKWKKSRLNNFYNKVKMQTTSSYTTMFNIISYNGVKHEYQWQCKQCNNTFISSLKDGSRPICPICFPSVTSTPQEEIYQYVNSFYKKEIIKKNTRTILDNNLELDIYIPHKKIAIELNGNYWHAELAGNKDRNYHLEKTQLCEKQNIQLIHIFEDEWGFKQQIVKNRLKNILGISKYKIQARKCIIKEIDVKLKNKFLNKYHIQGEDKSKIKLGCFYKDRLVAVMTFGKRKITGADNMEWELIRYCTIANFNCIGTAGKLLKHFERNYNPKQITTYADKRWSQGNMYYKLEFKLSHISKPNYWYMNKNYLKRHHRVAFQKHKLKDKLDKFDPKLSEWENMQVNGYDRIWDCGNMVFKKLY